MRDHFGQLTFDPRLPADWPELSYVLHWKGTRLQVTVTKDAMWFAAGEGEPVTFSVRGEEFTVQPESEVVVPLADQGPIIPGRPSPRQFAGMPLEDGSLLSASVPTVTTSIPIIPAAEPGSDDPLAGVDSDLGVDS
jgi:alpha,alpha-trehalose phosphorylase